MILIKFFGIIILFVVIFVLMMILSVVFRFWGFFRQLTGNTNGQQQRSQQNQWYGQQSQQDEWYKGGNFSSSGSSVPTGESVSGQPKPRNSVIDKNEGDYVDFEELP